MRGMEFRQAQTAISTYFIQQENNFSLAYPTPVLGKPWSIPMEFPLYQWTVVGLSNVTGMALTPAARVVSLFCFYATLPAVFLLLGQWQVKVSRRWLILGLIVSNPLYLVYSRGFLMETMALMLSGWFLLGYLRWLQAAKWGWLLTTVLFGAAAGLVKVTTFMLYLVPAVVGTLGLLWSQRPTVENPGWARVRRILLLSAVAVALPFAVTIWWMHFADVVKALNPSSQFLVSKNMVGYHFGTAQTRFAAKVWAGHWRIISESVIWLPLVGLSGVALLFCGRAWWAKVFFCLACFMGIQVLLPELYAWHDYYYVANTLFLLVGLGLAVTTLFDSRLPRWVGGVALVVMLAGQGYHFIREFYQGLNAYSAEGSDLSRAVKQYTRANDVVIVQGEDWNSMMPYYARRRAMMFRAGIDQSEAEIRAAFEQLKGEPVVALVTRGPFAKDSPLLKLAQEYFKIDPHPFLRCEEDLVYFADDRWDEVYDAFEASPAFGVRFLAGDRLRDENVNGRWCEVSTLRRYQTDALKTMRPKPVRFFSKFGLSLTGDGGVLHFGVHPETRLRFVVPAGARNLRTEVGLSPGAYENIPLNDATDGIEITLRLLQPGMPDQVLYSRYLNPRDNPADRGTVPIAVAFEMPSTGEIELAVTMGPGGTDRRDWAYLGPLTIE